MRYKVKIKKGVSIFHDKELANKCANEVGSKVEELIRQDRTNKIDRTSTEITAGDAHCAAR